MKNIKTLFLALSIIFTFSSFAQKQKCSKFDYLVTIHTDFGDMKVLLFDDTPIHKANFLKLIQEGLYNNNNFHRVINGFMIQGGNDTTSFNKGKDLNEITLPAEFSDKHKHIKGALAAARVDNPEKRSDRTQFYLVQNPNGTHFLDNQYTVFGQVMSGLDVIDKIAAQAVDANSKPLKEIKFSITTEKVKKKDIEKFYSYGNQ